MHSLMLYNERDMSPIQCTKNINGMASLVDAIRKIQEEYDSQGHIRIQLIYVHVKWLTEMKGKKLMNNHRQKQYHKAEQPPKKKNCGEKTSLRYEK